MSWQQLVMHIVVAFGLAASFRNPTAAALVVAWSVPQLAWRLGLGGNLPFATYLVMDLCVLAIIALKPNRTRWDVAITGVFAAMWLTYALPLRPYVQWHLLWALAIIQFISAFADAAESYGAQRRVARSWGLSPPGWFRIPGERAWRSTS